jgi:hypothetical protein
MIQHFFLVAACLLFAEGFAHAQTNESVSLKGLTSIGLLVDDLDEAAQRCGITKSLISDAFTYIASFANFKITDKTGPKFLVRVNTIIQQQPTQCISDLSVQVVNAQRVTLDFDEKLNPIVWVELWKDNWLSVSVAHLHPQQIKTAVEGATKKFVTQWNLANKP